MNKQPIEQARDADLRLAGAALLRAAERARALAQQTGTALVFSRDGVLEYLLPKALDAPNSLQSPTAAYHKSSDT